MFRLSKKMCQILERKAGVSSEELSELTLDQEQEIVKKIKGKKPEYPTRIDYRKMGRGNPLLARKRYRTMDYVHLRIDKMFK